MTVLIGTHYLLVNPSLAGTHPVSLIRPLAQQMFMRPWLSFSSTSLSFTNWKNNFRMQVCTYVNKFKGQNGPACSCPHQAAMLISFWNVWCQQKSGLRAPLPANVHMLTLEPWRDGTHLLRLEHVYDIVEHPTLSEPVTLILDVSFTCACYLHVDWKRKPVNNGTYFVCDTFRIY